MLRRVAILVGLSLLVSGAATAASGPRDEKRRIVPADQARARSVMLRRADFPARWRSSPGLPGSSSSGQRCPGLWSPDLSSITITGKADSPDFTYERTTASTYAYQYSSSRGEVYATTAQLAREWREGTSAAYVECQRRRVVGLFQGVPNVSAKAATVRRLPLGRVAPRQRAWRFTFPITTKLAGGGTVTFNGYADVVVLARGRAAVSLGILSLQTPPDRALVQRLATVTGKRLKAAFR